MVDWCGGGMKGGAEIVEGSAINGLSVSLTIPVRASKETRED